jgi:SpoVK/Ycf46/Vps4 family AAA+-type ATPase
MMCRKLTSLDSTFDLDEIVLKTPGFVGADLSALIDEALIAALNRQERILKKNKLILFI